MTVPKALSASGLLSTAEVAEKLGVHRSTVWLWIKSGALAAERRGAFHGVSPKALRNFRNVYKIASRPARKKKSKNNKSSRNKARGKRK